MRRSILTAFLLAVSPALAGSVSAGAPSTSVAPNVIAPGLYRVIPADPESRATLQPQNICIATPHNILRLQHQGVPGCRDQLVQAGQDSTIVTYSCGSAGWGRTELRRETPSLYQMDTQGIAGRQPFAMRAEVRRIGDCAARPTIVTGR